MDISKIKKCAPDELQMQSVTAVLLALGSNYQAEYYLARVRDNLATLGQSQLSTAFQNPDFTATSEHPKPDYVNQCAYLKLKLPMSLQQLQQTFKQFESDCDRCRLLSSADLINKDKPQAEQIAVKKVTMDIDILLIKLNAKNNSGQWIVMADRYPFKAHESAGVIELAVAD